MNYIQVKMQEKEAILENPGLPRESGDPEPLSLQTKLENLAAIFS